VYDLSGRFFPLWTTVCNWAPRGSPRLLPKIVHQGGTAPSFRAAAEDLHELAEVPINPAHVRRLCERLGRAWLQRQE